MIVKYKEREVEIDGISGTIDEPMIDNAFYLDGEEEELTQDEIMELEDKYLDELSQNLRESRTDDIYDLMNDR